MIIAELARTEGEKDEKKLAQCIPFFAQFEFFKFEEI